MREQPPRSRIRLELTRRQKEQIRKATGRTVNSLDLGLQGLPAQEPDERPEGEEKTDRRDTPGATPLRRAYPARGRARYAAGEMRGKGNR
jgi:hypothetical protein